MKKIKALINVGHGGDSSHYDSGALSPTGEHEHVLNRDIFYPHLKEQLEKKGFEVITIIQNKNFGELAGRINALHPDVIISLHLNSYSTTSTGTETLYYRFSKRSKLLAEKIQNKMVDALKLSNRGIKPLIVGRGSALLRKTDAPCIIIEPAFLSNPNDLKVWKSKVTELAAGIAEGLIEWVEAENS